jgi:signal peptide peptidase SppA
MIDAYALASSRPWLIQEESLQTILAIAERFGDPEALQTRTGRPLDNARTVSMRDGVAVIPVTGPIFRYANLFTEISGATATGILARDIQAALDNQYVRGIVLDMDSPGGEATGISELADLIASARGRKPVVAYVGGLGASAAYWLASAAEEIVLDNTAMLGSIGVVMSWLDTSERDAKSGVRRVEIVSSQSPDKRMDPGSEEGRAKVQAIVDQLGELFVGAVAKNRGVARDTVINDFGRGGVLVGAAAKAAGMADRIGSLESVIAELAGSKPRSTPKRKNTMADSKGKVTVSTTADLHTAIAAGYAPEDISIAPAASAAATNDAIVAARAEGVAEGTKASAETAVLAERKRIADIQGMARAGFDAELKAAIDNGDSPQAFALTLLTAAKDRGITLDAIGKDTPAAAAHAKPGGATNPLARTPNARDIYAKRREATQAGRAQR